MPGVYILKSLKNNSYYIGSTNDIERRLKEHENGMVVYTRKLRPLELKLYQECNSLLEARRLERRVKNLKRRDIIERMITEGKIITGP